MEDEKAQPLPARQDHHLLPPSKTTPSLPLRSRRSGLPVQGGDGLTDGRSSATPDLAEESQELFKSDGEGEQGPQVKE